MLTDLHYLLTLRLLRILPLLLGGLFMSGCSALGYYGQAIGGQLDILARTRPISELLDDIPAADGETLHLEPATKARLATSLQVRDFATQALALPNNNSYRVYAHLDRSQVAWNVVATPEFSLKPKTWCFPVAGCVPYRGYFSESNAQDFAAQLKYDGLDVRIAGVAAYSTLGWFTDPVFSTLMRRSEADLAGLIFHELAHQRLYLAGDAAFNESFASVVEAEGVRRWLQQRGDLRALEIWERDQSRQREFVELLHKYRTRLETLYASALPEMAMREAKARTFDALRAEYAELRNRWGGYAGYDPWFAQDLNNAHLAAVGLYHRHVPAFQLLLERAAGDMKVFYRSARALRRLPEAERNDRLAELGAQAKKKAANGAAF